MLRILVALALALTLADHLTTWQCLRGPVDGWVVTEANPVADWLFARAGLVGGLAIDSIVTLLAVVFLMRTPLMPDIAKAALLLMIVTSTGFAVVNNLQAIDAMNLWPGDTGPAPPPVSGGPA